jgi:hypothetical protein
MLIPPFTLRYPQNLNPLYLDFTDTTKVIDPRITFSRASSATYFDSAGVLQTAGSGVARAHAYQDYNPSTLAPLGFLIEEQRTNSIRNNTMVGAVAGTPGTLPTNWATFTALTGLTRTVVGTGTEDGIEYIDIRITGTPSGAGSYLIIPEGANTIAALNGQSWASTFFTKLVGGSLTGAAPYNVVTERSGAGAELARSSTLLAPTSSALRGQRVATTRTNGNASTAYELSFIELILSGVAIDITLRIGLPQLEQGAFATSVIKTTTAAATRLADSASITGTNFSSWYNQTEGTVFADYDVVGLASAVADLWIVNDGTITNFIRMRAGNIIAGADVEAVAGGIGVVDSASRTIVAGTRYTDIVAYKLNDYAWSFSGSTVGTDTTATVPTVTRIDIGAGLCKHFRRLSYYRTRLANQTLVSLTS